jgi:hypothetical protein
VGITWLTVLPMDSWGKVCGEVGFPILPSETLIFPLCDYPVLDEKFGHIAERRLAQSAKERQ